MPTACETPPALPQRAQSVADVSGHWCVARVRPRGTKAVIRELIARDEGFWLPMKREEKFRSCGSNYQRRYYIERPCFENYLFACFRDPIDVYSLFDFPSRPVFGILDVCPSAQGAFVRWMVTREIELKNNGTISVVPSWLRQGALCRVTSGPHRGFEGQARRISNRGRKVLLCAADGELIEADLASTTLEQAA